MKPMKLMSEYNIHFCSHHNYISMVPCDAPLINSHVISVTPSPIFWSKLLYNPPEGQEERCEHWMEQLWWLWASARCHNFLIWCWLNTQNNYIVSCGASSCVFISEWSHLNLYIIYIYTWYDKGIICNLIYTNWKGRDLNLESAWVSQCNHSPSKFIAQI